MPLFLNLTITLCLLITSVINPKRGSSLAMITMSPFKGSRPVFLSMNILRVLRNSRLSRIWADWAMSLLPLKILENISFWSCSLKTSSRKRLISSSWSWPLKNGLHSKLAFNTSLFSSCRVSGLELSTLQMWERMQLISDLVFKGAELGTPQFMDLSIDLNILIWLSHKFRNWWEDWRISNLTFDCRTSRMLFWWLLRRSLVWAASVKTNLGAL